MSKIFLALVLSIIIGGCSSINKSKVVFTKPAVAMTENNLTAQVTDIIKVLILVAIAMLTNGHSSAKSEAARSWGFPP